ncbi:hypothetical protein BWQ92_18135 [Arthrobacter sp. QXT-31]|nr:hypothetical protein [Arthrobacter sp. QXT-31]APX03384.1 hypothetical protein BWQ92_18135 [Arthrobacter sp. QXT-31]
MSWLSLAYIAAVVIEQRYLNILGWVMITLMSAVLVAALLALAGPALEAMFNQAMDTVGK